MYYNQLSLEQFIVKSNIIHNNKYDYSKTIYINSKIKVCIICPIHGEFWQTPDNHRYFECYDCGHVKASQKRLYDTNEFVVKAKIIHGNLYDYSKVNYLNSHSNIMIVCKIHGDFKQTPNSHLSGQGCPKCKTSKGEKEIMRVLKLFNIHYESQKKFEGCKYKNKLSFDFYLPDYHTCIEFDGEGHFEVVRYNGMDKFKALQKFKLVKLKDKIKNDFCNRSNIKLLRINDIKEVFNIIQSFQKTFLPIK